MLNIRAYFYFYPHLTHSVLNVFWGKNSAETKKFEKNVVFPCHDRVEAGPISGTNSLKEVKFHGKC